MTTAFRDSTAGLAASRWGGRPAGAVPRRPLTARIGQRLGAAGLWLWRALETIGQRRAQRELLLSAQYWAELDPELAAKLRDAARQHG